MRANRKHLTSILTIGLHAGLVCFGARLWAQPIIITNIPVANYLGNVSVNPNLNKIYLSGGYSGAQQIVVVDGGTLGPTGEGTGMGVDVDVSSNNYWSAGVYSGSVTVWSSSNTVVTNIALADCPGQVSLDAPHGRAWVSAQCGGGNDPVWAINADNYAVIVGPIGSGGIQGPIVVNPASDRLYFAPSVGSRRVNPSTFAVTTNHFGTVLGVNTNSNLLYAITNGTSLQIINGAPDPEVILTNVALPFSCGNFIGVNPVLNRIYLGYSGSNKVAVLDGRTGHTLETISLPGGITTVGSIAVDASRSRVYALAQAGTATYLFVIGDAPLAASIVLANDPNLKSPAYLSTVDGVNLLVTGVAVDNSQNVYQVPTAGGASTKLYTAYNPYEIVSVGNNFYWIDPNSGPITDTQILQAPTNGSGVVSAIYTGSQVGQPIWDGSGLTTDGAILYAADEVAGTVFSINADGSQLAQIGPARYAGSFAPEHLNTLAVAQNTLYVADSGKSAFSIPPAVLSIPTNGTSFTTLASGSPLIQPTGIAAGLGQLFVADPGATNTIWSVPSVGGTPSSVFAGAAFNRIQGVAYFNGVLYVADNGGGAIYKIAPAEPVEITSQPVSTTAAPGATVTLSVGATGYPLHYQWSFNGTALAGATGSTLTLASLSAADAGAYTVTISNVLGSVSQTVSVGLVYLQMFAGLWVDGPVGGQYSIQSAPALTSNNWTTRTNITLTSPTYLYLDYSSPTNAGQFYRAVPLAP